MGNHYSVSTTDQVFPVEHYFTDLPMFTLGPKLGSTRFMKVTRAVHTEGHCVVKIFVIHDRSLTLEYYDKALTVQREVLRPSMHCLPFSYFVRSEKFAAISRTFIKDTLYDRVNARPYFLDVEKRWIAFQILSALQECHEKNVCHGDIKSTNIVITSWNWVYLTDFASFKPTSLPDGDPADFSYFFDTSRRRTCYIAPERFIKGVAVTSAVTSADVVGSKMSLPDQQQEARMGALHWSMDIFSAGCVLLEFFGDGDVPFDLSRLLAYRNGDFYPTEALKKVENDDLRALIEDMIEKDPSRRKSAFEYLQSLRGKAFPDIFYTFFNGYLHGYCMAGIPDDKIIRLKKDLPGIVSRVEEEESTDCLLLILSLLLSNWRSLTHYDAKLAALDISETLAPLLPVDVVLDRLVPYLLTCAEDSLPTIRSTFLVTLTKILGSIPSIRRNEGHIFRAFILPDIEKLADDTDQRVRVTFAMHISQLAQTAMHFLELSYLTPNTNTNPTTNPHPNTKNPTTNPKNPTTNTKNPNTNTNTNLTTNSKNPNTNPNTNTNTNSNPNTNSKNTSSVFSQNSAYSEDVVYGVQDEDRYPFDVERMLLLKYFQTLLEKLFLRQSNAVKRALLEHGMGKMCQVFGRKQTREIILPHLVTFLNEKPDWQLRAAFFVAIVGLATFVGLESAGVFRALLEQGLTDPEEFVVLHALKAFLDLTKLQLMPKKSVTELLSFCAPLLIHPNIWIRRTAVALFVSASKKTDFADQQTRLRPLLFNFLSTNITFIDEEESLLNALLSPLNRKLFNIFTEDKEGDEISLRKNVPEYQLYQKLHTLDVKPQDKVKIMLSKDFICRLRLPSQTMEKALAKEAEGQTERTKKPTKLNHSVPIRSVPETPSFDGVNKQTLNHFMLRNSLGEEWSTVFGTEGGRDHLPAPASPSPSSLSGSSFSPSLKRELSLPASGSIAKHVRTPECEIELRQYIQNRLQERSIELSNEVSLTDLEPPPLYYDMLKEWRPTGLLVAHLHEHHNSVIRLRSNRSNGDILSCSLDGTVKLWDCARMEGRGLSNRAKYTYKHLGSPVRAITYCEEWKSFACAGENGNIHVVRLESDSTKSAVKLERTIDPKRDGVVVEMGYCDPGSQHIVAFATSMGVIAGWDLRTPHHVWKLQSDLRYGMLKTFCVSPEQSWITTGSSDGYIVTWDLRFRISISSIRHPGGTSITRLYTHPHTSPSSSSSSSSSPSSSSSASNSAVIVCVKGNNEVSVWDTETSSRTMAVWSGSGVPLVPSQPESQESIRGLQVLSSDARHLSFISAGTDRRIRFWDTFSRDSSYMIAAATGETLTEKKLLCKPVQIDGIEVVHEYGSNVKTQPPSANTGGNGGGGSGSGGGGSGASWLTDTESNSRALADAPAVGHADAINDLVICSTGSQMFLVTASRDGIIKVWK